jgi:hypothetical protein
MAAPAIDTHPPRASGVRKEERPKRPSSFSDAREPVAGGAAGASTVRSIRQSVARTMRLIMHATPQAVSRNGAAAADFLVADAARYEHR